MKHGAALIISIIILGAIFISFAIVGIQGIIGESGSLISTTHKKTADAMASACLDIALYNLGSNEFYAGNEMRSVNGGECIIRPIIFNGQNWTIETEAKSLERTSRIRTIISKRLPIEIISSEKVASF